MSASIAHATSYGTNAEERRLYPQRFTAWAARGLSPRAASALALACCDTVEQVSRLGRSYFEGRPNCGPKTLAELARLAGWPAKTPRDAIAQALRLSLSDPHEAEDVVEDVMIALRRNKFAIVTSRQSAPTGGR